VGQTAFERAVPPWDAPTLAAMRTLYAEGQRLGLRSDVFAKLGDSITESGSFAQDIGHGWYELGSWTRLLPVVQLFSRRAFSADREDNSFSRPSGAATAGWTTGHLLEGGDASPLERELATLRPAVAILMIGTNDAEQTDVATYTRNLAEILDRIARRKVVLLLSTIPELRSSPAAGLRAREINGVIRRVAATRHLPLIDYHAALADVPQQGVSDDNIHPSAYVEAGDTKAGVLTPAGLRFGYNVRNLTLLLGLERAVAALGIR